MKKIVAFLLAGCLALSLTACGQEPAGQTDPAEETVYPACFDGMEDLIAAARAEGALTAVVRSHTWPPPVSISRSCSVSPSRTSAPPPVRTCGSAALPRTAAPPLRRGS